MTPRVCREPMGARSVGGVCRMTEQLSVVRTNDAAIRQVRPFDTRQEREYNALIVHPRPRGSGTHKLSPASETGRRLAES